MASATNFKPHGLIRTRMQQQLYNKAHIANVYTGIADPKEHETVALMVNVLYKNIFTEDDFAVSNEQPANPVTRRHCEILVRYLENGSEIIKTLCFGECKRASTSQSFSLKALEEQAASYCKLYVEYENVPFVYAATMAGAHVRVWKYMQGDKRLTPFWGENFEGDWEEYKDIGHDEDGMMVWETFNEMKLWPPTPHAGQTSSSYTSYQPANTSSYSASNPAGHTGSYNKPAEASSGYSVSYTSQQGGYAVPSSSTQNQYGDAPVSYNIQTGQQSGYAVSSSSTQNQHGDALGPYTYDDNLAEPASSSSPQDQYGDASGSSSAWNQHTSHASASNDYIVVKVTKIPHRTRPDEFTFKDKRGQKRITTKSDWKEITYGGNVAWLYKGRKSDYVTYDKTT